MDFIKTYHCDKDSVCSQCTVIDTVKREAGPWIPGAWISYKCNHTHMSIGVKIETPSEERSTSDLVVCGIDVFGR